MPPSASHHREIIVLPTTVRLDGRFLWASLTHLRCRSEVLPNHPCLSQHFFIVWVRLATNNGATMVEDERIELSTLRCKRSVFPLALIPQNWRGLSFATCATTRLFSVTPPRSMTYSVRPHVSNNVTHTDKLSHYQDDARTIDTGQTHPCYRIP